MRRAKDQALLVLYCTSLCLIGVSTHGFVYPLLNGACTGAIGHNPLPSQFFSHILHRKLPLTLFKTSASASNAPAATPSSSSLIPNNVSGSCKTYLDGLDNNPDISNCLSTLVNATSEFNPSSATRYSDTALSTTLTALCGGSGKCDETKIRSQLANFYTACQSDLVGEAANDQVKSTYDILYVLLPLRNAVCAKNPNTNKYCVQEIHVDNSTSNSNVGRALIPETHDPSSGLHVSPETLRLLESNLFEVVDNTDYHVGVVEPRAVLPRADNSTQALIPDTKTWRSTSLVYLFISPEYGASHLCTSCTKAVLSAYVKFEAATPYALGLTNSPLLGDQLNLWNNLTAKCNTTFTNDILGSAGYNSNQDDGTMLGAASRAGLYASSFLATVMGLAAYLVL